MTRMLDIDESEIKLRNEFAAGFGQFRSDRLGLLEFRNVMTAETTVAGNQTLAGKLSFLVRRHRLQLVLSFDVRCGSPKQFEDNGVQRCGVGIRPRLFVEIG